MSEKLSGDNDGTLPPLGSPWPDYPEFDFRPESEIQMSDEVVIIPSRLNFDPPGSKLKHIPFVFFIEEIFENHD